MVEQSCLRFEADVDRRNRRRDPLEEERARVRLRGINRNIKEFCLGCSKMEKKIVVICRLVVLSFFLIIVNLLNYRATVKI